MVKEVKKVWHHFPNSHYSRIYPKYNVKEPMVISNFKFNVEIAQQCVKQSFWVSLTTMISSCIKYQHLWKYHTQKRTKLTYVSNLKVTVNQSQNKKIYPFQLA